MKIVRQILKNMRKLGPKSLRHYITVVRELIALVRNLPAKIDELNNSVCVGGGDKMNTLIKYFERVYEGASYIYNVNIGGEMFSFKDGLISQTCLQVAKELNEDCYKWNDIEFKDGDVVLDIGGNIGMVSIYLARKYPYLKIISFEPVKQNYENFLDNIKLNGIPPGVITVENKAITKDGRTIRMNFETHFGTGGSYVADIGHPVEPYKDYHLTNENVASTTLEQTFQKYGVEKCKLLKIDCEGSEYEILYNAPVELFEKIEYLRGEFHENKDLIDKQSADKLTDYCKTHFKDVFINYSR